MAERDRQGERRENELPWTVRTTLWLLLVAGLLLITFFCVLAYRDGYQVGLAVPFVIAALLVGAPLVGFSLTGPITLRRGDIEVKIAEREKREVRRGEDEKSSDGATVEKANPSAPEATVESPPDEDSGFRIAVRAYMARDLDSFDQAMGEIIKEEHDPAARLRYDAMRLSWLFEAGQGHRLQELEGLHKSNPTAPEPLLRLAECYLLTGQVEPALALYRQGKDLPEVNADTRLQFLRGEVNALLRSKDYSSAERCLDSAEDQYPADLRSEVHKLRASIYDAAGDQPKKHVQLEEALKCNPGDLSTRFDLAFSYSNIGERMLALYHYDIVVRQRNGATESNNLAVELAAMEMPTSAVQHYKAAIAQGFTLSSSNLARLMVKAGLTDDAQRVLDDALTMSDVHKNVHEAIAEIVRVKDGEEERWKRLLEAARWERDLFLRKMADDGRPRLDDTEILGEWETTLGKMTFSEDEGDYVARYKTNDLWDWALRGSIDRAARVFTFQWKTDYYVGPQSGQGYILFGENTFGGVMRDNPQVGDTAIIRAHRPA